MTTKKDTTGVNLDANAPKGLTVTDSEAEKARHEGAVEAVKEAAKDTRKALTDGAQPGEPATDPYAGSDESQQYAYMLDVGIDGLTDLVEGDESPVTDVMAAGLLKLERNGPNRTPYVRLLMKRLGLKGKDGLAKVGAGGPDYTNAMTNLSEL